MLKVVYMHVITLSGPATIVAGEVKSIKTEGALKGLLLNEAKFDAINFEGKTFKPSLQQFT